MEIAEPMTMITDYLITIYTIILAILLMTQFTYAQDTTVWCIALALLVTGIGALLGGSAHGFKPSISERSHDLLWRGTTMSIGIAAFFLLLMTALSSSSNSVFRWIFGTVAVIQLLVYLFWMSSHEEFVYVIFNYLGAMILVIILKLYSYFTIDDQSALWIIGSILISILASVIQAKGIGIHPKYFNHNDLFHVVQLPGFYLLYKAAFFLHY